MSQNKNFSRYFIILQEQDKGYGLTPNKVPTGYAKVECKNDKCKITFYVQNLKKENLAYYMFLIASKKNTEKLINLGQIKLDNTGRAEVTSEHDQDNIAGTNISFDKISGAALAIMNGKQVITPLVGFNTLDMPNFKDFKILNMYLKDDQNQEKPPKKEVKSKKDDKVDFEKYENEIEDKKELDKKELDENKIKEEKLEKPENLDELIIDDTKTRDDLIEDIHEGDVELDSVIKELYYISKNGINQEKLKPIIDQLNAMKSYPNMPLDVLSSVIDEISEMNENTTSEQLQKVVDKLVDIEKYEEFDEYMDMDRASEDLIIDGSLDDDIVQSTIEKEKSNPYDDLNREYDDEGVGIGEDEYVPYNYNEEDLRHDPYLERIDDEDDYPTGSVGKFFKDALKDFDKIKNFAPEIKSTKWYRVNVDDLDCILDDEDHNKYTVVYYPMINYYPYFSRFNHYIVGLKHDENGKMKYIVYGVPGIKDKYSQPLDGKTGFVIWVPNSTNINEEMGYWLLFYDFKNSTILIPEK